MKIRTRYYLVVALTVFLCVVCTIVFDFVFFKYSPAGSTGLDVSALRFMFEWSRLLVYLAIFAGGALFAAVLANTVLPRLEKGARFAESVVSGALSGKLNTGRDELGVIFEAFNVIIDQLDTAKATATRCEREAMTATRQLDMQNARLEILIAARTEELHQAYKYLLDLSPTAMILIRGGEVRLVNERGTELFGLRLDDNAYEVFAENGRNEKIINLIESGETMKDRPAKMTGADGRALDVLLSVHPLMYEDMPSLFVWISDVTDLVRAKAMAEDASRARTAFLAAMSHDIRTPFDVILVEICKKYDEDSMEKTVSALNRFTSSDHEELTEWIALTARSLDYDKIADRLEKSGVWTNGAGRRDEESGG